MKTLEKINGKRVLYDVQSKGSSSQDFRIAGAYPGGADYNTRRATPDDFAAALPEIGQVPLPDSDPVYGEAGPLLTVWEGI